MKIDNLEVLLLQEMEEVKGGTSQVCSCSQGGAGSALEGSTCKCSDGAGNYVCECTSGALTFDNTPRAEKNDPLLPVIRCNCTSGASVG